jgi:hypothetical protein
MPNGQPRTQVTGASLEGPTVYSNYRMASGKGKVPHLKQLFQCH